MILTSTKPNTARGRVGHRIPQFSVLALLLRLVRLLQTDRVDRARSRSGRWLIHSMIGGSECFVGPLPSRSGLWGRGIVGRRRSEDCAPRGSGGGKGGSGGEFFDMIGWEEALLSVESAGPPISVRLFYYFNDIAWTE